MLLLAIRNLAGRPLRNGLAIFGLAVAVAALACLTSFGDGYEQALRAEIDKMGLQLMLVPLGCPYDAAARVLKGRELDNSLPESAVIEARKDPAVAIAAPLFIAASPRPTAGRADMWVGLDEAAVALKPWWRASAGESWFPATNSVILGAEAAEVEMRTVGDVLFSPEAGQAFRVAGILERSGTSDDSLFFLPLRTAQQMFHHEGRLTAVAIRLRDPTLLGEVSERLQRIPGAQVVTLTEMMGTFLNLIGSVRTLLVSVTLIAIAISTLSVLNTLLAALVERTNELAIIRALGGSRLQIFSLLGAEALLLTTIGSFAGVILALIAGGGIEDFIRRLLPLSPAEPILLPSFGTFLQAALLGGIVGLLGGLYPAWRASRLEPAEGFKAT